MRKKIYLIVVLSILFLLGGYNKTYAATRTVYNESQLRQAINDKVSDIIAANSINIGSTIYINYAVEIRPGSNDNALRYSGGGNFFVVQNGGNLTIHSMVIDMGTFLRNRGVNAVNVQSGGRFNFYSALLDGGNNPGVIVNSGATADMRSGNLLGCTKGVIAYGNANLAFTGWGDMAFWSNTTAISFENFTGTCNLNQSSVSIRENSYGIVFESGTGKLNISSGSIYNNTSMGVFCKAGNTTISGGAIRNNTGNGVEVRNANFTMNGGSITSNVVGIAITDGYSGKVIINSGTISSNTKYAINHWQIGDGSCTINGGSISGQVYLGKADNYVNTYSKYPTFTVTPSVYSLNRKLVKTDSNAIALNELSKVTLTPNGNWYKYVGSDEYIVVWTGGNVRVKFIDTRTKDILDQEILNDRVGATWTSNSKDIEGYRLVIEPETKTGTYQTTDINLTYEYIKLSKVITKYIDKNYNTEIEDQVEKDYAEDEEYTTDEKTIENYTLVDEVNTTGTMARENVEAIYYYKRNSGGIEVKYVDQVTKQEIDTKTLFTGLEKDAYEVKAKNVDGYELVSTQNKVSGEMSINKITITFEYRKNSNVTVKYIDENYNTTIIDDIVTKYKEGDSYTTEEKTFDGYRLTDKTTNTSGTIVRENIEVVYKYKKISEGVDIKYIDQVTKTEIGTLKHIDGLEKDSYTTTPKDIEGYELVLTPTNANSKMEVSKITVTYEYRKNSNVTVRYIDENYNTTIIEEIVTKYKEGDSYTTEEKTFKGYRLTDKTTNTSGTIVRDNIEIVYKYKKISEGVDIKYIDQVTKAEIGDVEHLNGLEKDNYTTTPKDIEGYELVLTPTNANSKMEVNKITVTYEYRKNSNVTAKYMDKNYNTKIIDDVVTKYKEADSYTTEEKTFEGYRLTDKTANTLGIVVRENIEVVYGYKKISEGVDVKYIDQVTKAEIGDLEHLNGLEKDSYTTTPKDIEGYELVLTPENSNGEMIVGKTTVTYEYRKNSNVTVKYIDENYNTTIIDDIVTKYKEGDPYTTEEKTFDGYRLTDKTTNTSGTVVRDNIEVVYKYKKISEGVDIKYIDQVTKTEIGNVEHLNGLEKDSYTTTPKEIEGYELVLTPGNSNGEMTVGKTTVTYEYRKNSNVTVKYIDENYNTTIIDDIVTKYKEGDSYTTEEKTFDGYRLTDKTTNTSGTVVRDNIEVVYKYKKISEGVDTKYIDQVTKVEIETVVHQDGLEKDSYTTTPKEIEGYELVLTPGNSNGEMTVGKTTVTYEYRKNSNVTVKYIDENYNTTIIDDIVTKYKEGDPYTTEEKTFDGYRLTDKTTNTSGTVVRENIEVVYKYKKISEGVDIKYIDQVTKVEIGNVEHLNGLEKDNYTTTPKDIEGYELVLTPTNASSKMEVSKITVTYEYRKNSNVTVKYIDENYNTTIIDDIVTKYKEGDPYTTEEKTFEGYRLTDKTTNTSGTVVRENIEIVYKYKKISEGVDTKYIDQVTKVEIETVVHQEGLEKDNYTTAPKEIEGYELVLTPTNINGKMEVGKITVTYEYRKNSNVIVKYINELSNEEIIDSVITKYKQGDTYSTEHKVIEGYHYTEKTSGQVSGTVERDDIIVIYYYINRSEGVNTRYIDQVTKAEIETMEHQDGIINQEYTTAPKEINGYELVLIPDNSSGKMILGLTTVTYEYRKNSNVTVKYIDENYNTKLADDIVTKYKEGDPYTTEEKTFAGYRLTDKTTNTSGTVVRENIEVVYKYKKISEGVDIKYIDQVTKTEIGTLEHIDGLEKDDYTTTPKDIEGYELVLTPENSNGEMIVEKTIVTYEYRKNSYVTVKYIDENSGNNIIDDIVTKYKEGDTYITDEKKFEGYALTNRSPNLEGVVVRDNIEVVYKYKKVSEGVDTKYIDQVTGNEIAEIVHRPGLEKSAYTTYAKEIDGYELVLTPTNATGEMTVDKITVVYEYRKNSNVIVRHIDENSGELLIEQQSRKYKEGDLYITNKEEIEGYSYTRIDGQDNGIVERENITVTYYYKKNTAVVVKYVDMLDNNREIAEQVVIQGLQNDEYETEQKEIEGYIFEETSGIVNGKMKYNPIEVVYKYKKVSNLITEHIDANTNENIIENVVRTYKEGAEYEAYAQDLEGYVLVEEPEEKVGVMGRENVIKTFKYKKISKGLVVKYVDRIAGDMLDQKIYEGNENDVINLNERTFLGYVLDERPDFVNVSLTVDPIEVTYYYRKAIGIDVIGIDQETSEQIYNTKVSGIEGDTYTTVARNVEGYQLIRTPENQNGIFERKDTKVTYEYRKVARDVIVRYINKETGEEFESYRISGKEGDNYQTQRKEYENYTLVEVVGNEVGILTTEEKEVKYYYERKTGKVAVIYEDEEGNEILREELTGKVGEEYRLEVKEVEGFVLLEPVEELTGIYDEITKEIRIKLKNIQVKPINRGTIIIKFINENGQKIKEDYIQKGEIGEKFEYQLPEIEGHKVIGKTTVEAKFVDGELTFEIKYKKIDNKVLDNLPATGDVNIVLYIIAFAFSFISLKKLLKNI